MATSTSARFERAVRSSRDSLYSTGRSRCARRRRASSRAGTRASASTSTMGTSGGILSGDDAFVRLASTMGAGNGTSRVKGVALEDVVRGADGPPRMFSPTTTRGGEAASSSGRRPLAAYLPGLDGTGFSASSQFEFMATEFEVVALNVPAGDRSDVFELVGAVTDFLDAHVERARARGENTEVYLVGESMGGLLSLCVASERPDLITRLILVNPASSFDKSAWSVLGPALPSIPNEFWGALPYALTPVLFDPLRMASGLMETIASAEPQEALEAMTSTVVKLAESIPAVGALAEIIPRDTLAHRLDKVLGLGCEYLNRDEYARLRAIDTPTLVVASENDNLIPSLAESERLRKFMPRVKVHVLRGASHAALQEPGVNLMTIARNNAFLPKRPEATIMTRDDKFDPPSPADIERARESLAGLRAATSPVFFSTRPDGKIVRGLGAVPIRQRGSRPILLVGNHQTMAPDLGFLVDEFLREYDTCVRGLAHPVVSRAGVDENSESRSFEDMMRDALKNTPAEPFLPRREPKPPRRAMNIVGGGGSFNSFGAVPVNAFNFYRLMKQGEVVLLFPGGVREAFKRKNEKYELFWPSKSEFVRMAIKHDAIIVPFAAIGAEDSLEIVADANDLLTSPVVGTSVRERASSVPSARAIDTRVTNDKGEEELFIQPILVPRTPQRFYFRFMAPMDVADVDLNDESHVNSIYQDVYGEVGAGIDYLLEKRETDPFKELLPRLLYENATSQQAPTFDMRSL